MKKLYTLGLVLSSAMSFGQEIHRCYTHESMQAYEESHPGYLSSVNEVFERAKYHESSGDRSTVYTIPVVVHIVYNTPEENLADSVIFKQIETLNEDFRRLNADTVNTRDTFQTIVGDSFIQFELATVDPDGNPTNGITRTSTATESFLSFTGGGVAEDVKTTSTGGIDPWDQDRYLNIWVCDMSFLGTPFVLGYATPPDGLPHWPAGSTDGMSDGVVIQYEVFGANNPNTIPGFDIMGRTTTHEVGHYLGLRHIWGDGDCTQQDGVDDTPNADDQSNQDCDFAKNTCVDAIGTLGDLPDMVENYMDYSAETCQNSFTNGQIEIMRGVLETQRIDLITFGDVMNATTPNSISWTVYPNPSSDGIVTVEGTFSSSATIEVYNESGSLITSQAIQNSKEIITLNQAGVFFIRVIDEATIETRRIVVVK